MITVGKAILGLSALISAGFVAITQPAPQATDVAAKADRIVASERAPDSCDGQSWPFITGPCLIGARPSAEACDASAWPYVAAGCLVDARDEARRVQRSVTIERRIDAQTSELIRVPVDAYALR